MIIGYLVEPDGTRAFIYGKLHLLFDLHLWAIFTIAFFQLIFKYSRVQGLERLNTLFIILGTYAVLAIAGVSNVIAPLIGIFNVIWIGPSATIFWVGVVAYAVIKHQLFNIRTIAAELLVVSLWLLMLFRVFFSETINDVVINGLFFLVTLVLGMLLIRSILLEVFQRELIEKQAKDLETINTQQENLLHFISHEVKGYLAKSEAAFAAIVQGDYGEVSPELGAMSRIGLDDMRKGVRTVIDILDASNLKKGTVYFKNNIFDMRDVVEKTVKHLKPTAEEKGLTVETSIAWEVPCKINGDEAKIREHVVRNLIDNAIKYTPAGSIKVKLAKTGNVIRFVVEDSGVGITSEDMQRLFTEGGHGKDSIKINVHSTGYGLYIAKQVVDAHKGKIWAESDGQGKGSRFIVELPAA